MKTIIKTLTITNENGIQIEGLTGAEANFFTAFLANNGCAAKTPSDLISDNFSWQCSLDMRTATKLTNNQVGGFLSSLEVKGFIALEERTKAEGGDLYWVPEEQLQELPLDWNFCEVEVSFEEPTVKTTKKPKAIKTILERKDAKKVLEMLSDNKSVTTICTSLKLWGNRVRWIKAELIKADLFKESKTLYDFLGKMTSKHKDAIDSNFRASKRVSTKELLEHADITRLTAGMKLDLQMLLDSGFVTKEKEGTKVFYIVKKYV